ncbi:MAG: MFS transporter, partial [Rhodospirillales bacterium]|nr:MFS transporter [Rhodospirillales bacterium]
GRRRVMVPMLFLYGLAGAASGLAPDFESLLLLRFLTGISAGSLGSLSLVLVGDLFSDKDRPRIFGIRMAVGQIGNGTVPLVAGLLALIGWQYPFGFYALAIPVGFFALSVMDKDGAPKQSTLKNYLAKTFRAISSRKILSLLIIPFSLTVVNHGINLTYVPIFMDQIYGASAVMIGLMVSARVTVGALLGFNLGHLVARFGEVRLLHISFVALALSFVATPFMPSVWWMLVPSFLAGINTGMGFPSFQPILVRQAPEGTLAGIMAANSVTARTGQTLGPLLAGLAFVLGGLDLVFFAAAGVTVAALIFLIFALAWSSSGANSVSQ